MERTILDYIIASNYGADYTELLNDLVDDDHTRKEIKLALSSLLAKNLIIYESGTNTFDLPL